MIPLLRPSGARWAGVATVVVLAAGACAAPADVSREYRVILQTSTSLVYRGEGTYATATLWHYVGTDSTPVPNALLVWSGGDNILAIETTPPGDAAILFGIARGTAHPYVEAPGYGGDNGGGTEIRVVDQVELDTVLQSTVAWGGRLTLRGVRVGDPNDVSVRLNGVTLIPDTLSLVGGVDQVQQMSYFVPVGTTSGPLQLTGFGLIATDSTPITVLPQEAFEPNDLAPHIVPLDTAQPYPAVADPPTSGHPEIHFFEPLLLYEAATGPNSITTDWFHFVAAVTNVQPWTFVYTSPAIPSRGAFGGPATLTAGVPIFNAGAFGFDFDAHALVSRCRGTDLQFPVIVIPDSLALSLQTLPASGIDFVSYTSNAGVYGLDVVTGYRTPAETTPGHTVTPDKFEDNDFCEQADANFAIAGLKIDLGSADFSDTLTIDTPFEVDWFRFHVASGGTITLQTTARNGFDDAALDLYLFRQSDLHQVDAVTGSTTASGSLSRSLNTGDYYLVVANTDGRATRYGLCITANSSCAAIPGAMSGPTPRRRR